MADKVLENDLMFFYGSLQRGEFPYQHLGLASMLAFVGDASFAGELRDMGQYPACKLGTNTVHGELFKVTDVKVADILDRFERFDADDVEQSLYVRQRITLHDSALKAHSRQVWTYLYNQDFSLRPIIKSGHWLAHKRACQDRADFKGFEN